MLRWNLSGCLGFLSTSHQSHPSPCMASYNKPCPFLHHNLVSVDWLYCTWVSRPKFGSVTKAPPPSSSLSPRKDSHISRPPGEKGAFTLLNAHVYPDVTLPNSAKRPIQSLHWQSQKEGAPRRRHGVPRASTLSRLPQGHTQQELAMWRVLEIPGVGSEPSSSPSLPHLALCGCEPLISQCCQGGSPQRNAASFPSQPPAWWVLLYLAYLLSTDACWPLCAAVTKSDQVPALPGSQSRGRQSAAAQLYE